MHASKSSKPAGSDANTFEIRKFNTAIVANHDVLNMPGAIDERPDLPARFVGQLRQLSSEFRCDYLVGRYAASVQLFYAP